MINSRVLAVVITMVFGLVLSAEARYKEDIAEARLRSRQYFKSDYSLKNKPATGIPATVRGGARVVARPAVSGPITRQRAYAVTNRLTTMRQGSPVTGMSANLNRVSRAAARSAAGGSITGNRFSSLVNRPQDSRIFRTSLRANPNSFRANRGSISRLR